MNILKSNIIFRRLFKSLNSFFFDKFGFKGQFYKTLFLVILFLRDEQLVFQALFNVLGQIHNVCKVVIYSKLTVNAQNYSKECFIALHTVSKSPFQIALGCQIFSFELFSYKNFFPQASLSLT
jgi:hypothetical protein